MPSPFFSHDKNGAIEEPIVNVQTEDPSDQFLLLPFTDLDVVAIGARLAALEGEVFLLKHQLEKLQKQSAETETPKHPPPAKG